MPIQKIHDIPVVTKYDWKQVKADTKTRKSREFQIWVTESGISLTEVEDTKPIKVNAVYENNQGSYVQRSLLPAHKVGQFINVVTNKNVNGAGNKSLKFVKVASTKRVKKVDGETKKPVRSAKPKAGDGGGVSG